jgi:Beta-propeller repeat.
MEASDRLAGNSNYLGAHAVAGVPRFARVRYHDVWRGIDVVFYGTAGQMEYDFVLAPGANPRTIQLELEGAAGITRDSGGLIFHTPSGELRQRAPVIYQDGRRIDGSYVVRGRTIGFELSRYDRRRELVIDPVLSYVARFGARSTSNSSPSPPLLNSFDRGGNAIAVDAEGNAYVVGSAFTADFPTTPGAFQPRLNDSPTAASTLLNDVFVMKLNPSGSALVYSTFLGGSADDVGVGIAIDAEGNAYVCGLTSSADLPTTPGAFQTVKKSSGVSYTALIAKLNPAGSALVYSTFLGGSTLNDVRSIALDSARNAYVTGWTTSADFPITPGAFQPVAPAAFGTSVAAAYVTKLNAAGSGLVYSTFLARPRRQLAPSLRPTTARSRWIARATPTLAARRSTQRRRFPLQRMPFQARWAASYPSSTRMAARYCSLRASAGRGMRWMLSHWVRTAVSTPLGARSPASFRQLPDPCNQTSIPNSRWLCHRDDILLTAS